MNKCPKHPHAPSSVKDSRPCELYGGTIRRRRSCDKCNFKFSTWELYEHDVLRREKRTTDKDKIARLLAELTELI